MIKFWWDGVCEPINPGGHCAYGTYIQQNGKVLLSESGYIGRNKNTSNNVAEYAGFIRALEFLKEKGLNKQPIYARGDSNLVVQQVQYKWRIRSGHYVPYAMKARALISDFPNIRVEWIPREENGKADVLSKQVLKNMGVRFRIQPEEEDGDAGHRVPSNVQSAAHE